MGQRANEVNSFTGKRIREERTLRGMTQEMLATALGLSYQQIQKYETGANRVSVGRFVEISEVFECSPLDLLPSDGDDMTGVEEHGGKNRNIIEAATLLREIPAHVRSAFMSLLRETARHTRNRVSAE